MPDALDLKIAELERRLLTKRDQIGRGVGVPFLLLLHAPAEELRVRREAQALIVRLRAQGLTVDRIDGHQVLIEHLESQGELERAIRAERRAPERLRELGLGEGLADAVVERVATAARQLGDTDVIILTRLGALYPFLLPTVLQERLAGRRLGIPIIFLVPADEDQSGDYLFLGVERARRYRGTYL